MVIYSSISLINHQTDSNQPHLVIRIKIVILTIDFFYLKQLKSELLKSLSSPLYLYGITNSGFNNCLKDTSMNKLNKTLLIILSIPLTAYAAVTQTTLRAAYGAKCTDKFGSGKFIFYTTAIQLAAGVNNSNIPYTINSSQASSWGGVHNNDDVTTMYVVANRKNTKEVVNWVANNNKSNLNGVMVDTKNANNVTYSNATLNDKTPAKLDFAFVATVYITMYGPNGIEYEPLQTYTCNNVTFAHGGKNWWIYNNYPTGYIFSGIYTAVQAHQLLCTNDVGNYNVLNVSPSGKEAGFQFYPLYKDFNYELSKQCPSK